MKKYLTSFVVVLLSITVVFLANCGGKKGKKIQERTLRLGHVLSIDHPVHKAMQRWSKLLEKETDGQINIKIYPGGQLGGEKEMVENLQMGTLDITKISSAALASFVPEMKVFTTPYLFRSNQHKWKVLKGEAGQQILNECKGKELIGLGYYEAGARSFYTKNTPIRKPSDVKNMKIRVMKSPLSIELLKTLDASPTPISWGELYTALQQGTVEGAENNPPSFVSARHYEVCQYYSLDKHSQPVDVVLFNKKLWSNLSDKEKEVIKDTFWKSVEYQRKLWKEEVKRNFATLDSVGVEVIRPDLEPFREAVQPIYDKYKNDEVIGSYIKKIKAVKTEEK